MEDKFAVSLELSICWQQMNMAIVVGFKKKKPTKVYKKTPTLV